MFKQGKGANIHVAIKIYAIADLLQGEIAILMQHEKTEAWCFFAEFWQDFGRILCRIFGRILLIYA